MPTSHSLRFVRALCLGGLGLLPLGCSSSSSTSGGAAASTPPGNPGSAAPGNEASEPRPRQIAGWGGQMPSRNGQPCTGNETPGDNGPCECVAEDGGHYWHCQMPIGGPLMPPELPA